MDVSKIALLGCGVFARDAYIPVLRSTQERWQLAAVWSRSEATVQEAKPTLTGFAAGVATYSGDTGLQQLLARADILIVIICVPVQAVQQLVQQCLLAGKHVLQEKPLALNTAEASRALEWAKQQANLPCWGLAENYRSEAAFRQVEQLIPSLGKITKIDVVADFPIGENNKYFNSQWRRDCAGGFVTDVGVHFVAALRMLARAAGWGDISSVSALTTSPLSKLPQPDTLIGLLSFQTNGISTMSITYAGHVLRFAITVVGTEGTVEVQRGGFGQSNAPYHIAYKREGDSSVQHEDVGFTGITDELQYFLQCIKAKQAGQAEPEDAKYRISLQEGLRDLEVVEGLLQSAAHGGQVVRFSM